MPDTLLMQPAAPKRGPALHAGHTRTLGATIESGGVNFALAAPHASRVDLCVFDPVGKVETARYQMSGCSNGIWHGWLPDSGEGLVYGWRVHGPWAPAQGHRFNPAKLLLDPCARELVGHYGGESIHVGHDAHNPALPDQRDNAAFALKARVVADLPDTKVTPPVIDPARRVIYELHVKGFTAQHPGVAPALRGTYAGLSEPAAIAHLKALGISTVCLMPVAHRADEARLLAAGLSNYWGYSPVAWNAPEARYWSGATHTSPRSEFRALVDALHAAGLEVVLDVVYNHTGETDEFGPTLSMRGIDNALYYHLLADDRSGYANWSGCGNCVNLNEPLVLRTVMDSLRSWVQEFGVDGFRFDLAPILARGSTCGDQAFQPQAPLFLAIAQDPILRNCLMIAEPWDTGPGGYQLGAFPTGWLEWNDRFRDTQRGFWLHHQGSRGAFASRVAGSRDVFGPQGRTAHSSVNFVTAHDGFTLRDLVSYSRRHNQANGEDNRDGHGHNLSVNNGAEGDTEQPEVLAKRARQQRVLLASLLLSLGTPMLLGGDEIGHTQKGNNNAYCQDNTSTWLNWTQANKALCGFVSRVLALRRQFPLLSAAHWWQREDSKHPGPVALWYSELGKSLSSDDWERESEYALALQLKPPLFDVSSAPRPVCCLLLFNANAQAVDFHLPPGQWVLRLDTYSDGEKARVLGPVETVSAGSLWLAVEDDTPPPERNE